MSLGGSDETNKVTDESEEILRAGLPSTEPIDKTHLSVKQQEDLQKFQGSLQTNLDKQIKAQEKADAANTKSYLEHYKDDMKGMWEQTKKTFQDADIAKDEYEAFAQLLQFLLQLLAFATSPASQALNAAGQKTWDKMKESYHQRQADLQGEKYNNIEHQQAREKQLNKLINQSTNTIAELEAKKQKADLGKAARIERQIAFEKEKLNMLTEARNNTTENLSKLKQLAQENPNEQTVQLATAPGSNPDKEHDIMFTTTTATATTTPDVTGPQVPMKAKPTSAENAPSALEDLLEPRAQAITPKHKSRERTSVINDTQLSINELHEKLKSSNNEQLSALGIKKFDMIEPTTPEDSSHIKLEMYCSADKSSAGKTTEVTVEHKPGTEGAIYSMKKNISEAEKQQTIEQICKLAVETAKPGTEFKIPTQNPERKAATEAALDKALQTKYPNYVKGQFKIPDATPKSTAALK